MLNSYLLAHLFLWKRFCIESTQDNALISVIRESTCSVKSNVEANTMKGFSSNEMEQQKIFFTKLT